MAIAHPSRYYIHYLLSQSSAKNTDDDAVAVVTKLGELGLPVPQDDLVLRNFVAQLKACRSKMKPPPGFNPAAAKHTAETTAYLRTWRIEDAWRGKLRPVLALFDDRAEVRRAISVMLLGPLSPSVISTLVRKHFGLKEHELNTRIVQLYAHYFWNSDLLDVQGWKRVLSKAWYPGHVTDFYIALDATRDAVGAASTMNVALRQGASVDAVHAFTTMQHYGFRMFMEAAASGGPMLPRAQSAALAFNIYKMSEEELDRRRGGSSEVIEELRRIGTLYDRRALPTVIDIPVTPKVAAPVPTEPSPPPEETPR